MSKCSLVITLAVAVLSSAAAVAGPPLLDPELDALLNGKSAPARKIAPARPAAAGRKTISSPLFNFKRAPRSTSTARPASRRNLGQRVGTAFRDGIESVTPKPRVVTASDTIAVGSKGKRPGSDFFVSAARIHEQMRDDKKAVELYERALEFDSGHLDSLVGLARLRDRNGQLSEAAKLYAKAAARHPEVASVQNDLGLCHARLGRLEESRAAISRAAQMEPRKDLYRNNLATVLTEMGRYDDALEHLAAVHAPAVANFNLGFLLQERGQAAAATARFTEALRLDPSLTAARDGLQKLNALPRHAAGGGSDAFRAPTWPHANPQLEQPRTVRQQPTASYQPPLPRGALPTASNQPPLPRHALRMPGVRTGNPASTPPTYEMKITEGPATMPGAPQVTAGRAMQPGSAPLAEIVGPGMEVMQPATRTAQAMQPQRTMPPPVVRAAEATPPMASYAQPAATYAQPAATYAPPAATAARPATTYTQIIQQPEMVVPAARPQPAAGSPTLPPTNRLPGAARPNTSYLQMPAGGLYRTPGPTQAAPPSPAAAIRQVRVDAGSLSPHAILPAGRDATYRR